MRMKVSEKRVLRELLFQAKGLYLALNRGMSWIEINIIKESHGFVKYISRAQFSDW